MGQGKREDQVRSAQLGLFIGFIGIMIVLCVAVVVGELTAQDSLESKEPNVIYQDTINDDMLDIDMDCGDDLSWLNQIHYDSIPRYNRFTDVPAGTDTIIIVDEILYKMNNKKTTWTPIYPDEYRMWIGDNGDTIWE